MPVKDYVAAVKPRTVLLLVLAVVVTIAAVVLQAHVSHGCFDGGVRLARPALQNAAGTRGSIAGRPHLVRVLQQQDEGAEIQPAGPPCPKNEDMSIAASVTPWLAVLLWVGFAASLQVDLDGRRKRKRRRSRTPSAERMAWPPAVPAKTGLKEDDDGA